MYLYHLTVQSPTHIPFSVSGSFTSSRAQELVVARGSNYLELLQVSSATGHLQSLSLIPLFCTLRSMTTFRLPGDEMDYLILGTDSGRIIILNWKKGHWEKVHQETFGRSGVRRTGPGEYVASDPRGRAIMISAVERTKIVYIMNRDPNTSNLTISSPLEANKSNVVVFSLVALDSGYDNPVFAALEVDCSPGINDDEVSDPQLLDKIVTFYEVDLGVNHVSRKWSERVEKSSNLLVAVPGGEEGPGGVLVCFEGGVSWHRMGFKPVSIKFPIRSDPVCKMPKRLPLVCSGSIVRSKTGYFHLLQTEEGDLFRITIELDKGQIKSLHVQYFDSVPVSSSIQVLRSGFLFVSPEWSSHLLYQIQSLGEEAPLDQLEFLPKSLVNLALVDQLNNFAELIDSKVLNLANEETPQIYAVQGRNNQSTFNIMRQGLHATEVAASELPAEATGIWTVKKNVADEESAYIVVSFADNSTVVLQVGETVEEATDTGILNNVSTILIGQLDDSSIVQVHPKGLRQIRSDGRVNEWKSPPSAIVKVSSSNNRQVVLALNNNSLVYFEADLTGMLLEKKSITVPDPVISLTLGEVPTGRQRCRFLAVGTIDMVVRILSCDADDCLEPLSLQALAAKPSSLLISELGDIEESIILGSLVLDIGLENGMLARLRLDSNTGALTDARTRFLGTEPVRLFKSLLEGKRRAILAVSSRSWLGYIINGQNRLSPLSHPPLSGCAPFSSEQCPSGMVVLEGSTLKILTVENAQENFTRHQIPLSHCPRKLSFHPGTSLFAIGESDHREFTVNERETLQKYWNLNPDDAIRIAQFSYKGKWSSVLRLLNPFTGETLSSHQFSDNETITSLSFVSFHARINELFLAVGVAKNLQIMPREASSCSLLLFLVDPQKGTLSLTHSTAIDQIPSCINAFGGRLLVSVGPTLRLYDIGRRQLLRKCEIQLPTSAITICTQGWRVFVGDSRDSVLFLLYHTIDNRFQLVADDTVTRPITSMLMLDYDSVAVADRFGSFCILRISSSLSEDLESESASGSIAAKRPHLFGAPFKLERLAEFYVGDTITSLNKTSLVYGSRDLIMYTTISGAIGILMPFTSREEALLFQNLEMHLRQEIPANLTGRDHLIYRSLYAPVKSVIDGDLCETWLQLSGDRKHFISNGLDKTPADLLKKIQDMRVTAGI